MKKVSITSLAQDVSTLLGEPSEPECQPEESPFPGVKERVRILAPGLLSILIEESAPENFTDFKSIDPAVKIDERGVVTLALPADFLRLAEVKMSDWSRGVSRITNREELIFGLQMSPWAGLRGVPERPVVLMEKDGKGGRSLRMYSSKPGATLEYALYIPTPKLGADDTLEIPDRLYYPLLEKLAEIIGR